MKAIKTTKEKTRLLTFEKYELIENIKITKTIQNAFQNINPASHDAVDISLLNAVCADIVNILVTDDKGIHKKAKKIGIEDKVYDLSDSLNFVNGQLPKTLKTNEHPIIKTEKCYNIDVNETFFDSLRCDYKNFNNWFIKNVKKRKGIAYLLVMKIKLWAFVFINLSQNHHGFTE